MSILKKCPWRKVQFAVILFYVMSFALYGAAYVYTPRYPMTMEKTHVSSDSFFIDSPITLRSSSGGYTTLKYTELVSSASDYGFSHFMCISGDMSMNPITIDLSIFGTLNTADAPLPICQYGIDCFLITDGGRLTISGQDLKFLPCTGIFIEEGGELILDDSALYFYTAEDYLYTYNYIGWTGEYDSLLINYGTITCKNGGAVYSSDPNYSNVYGYDGDSSLDGTTINELQTVYNPVEGEADHDYGLAEVSFYAFPASTSPGNGDSSGGSSGSGGDDAGTGSDNNGTSSGDPSGPDDKHDDDSDTPMNTDLSIFSEVMKAAFNLFQIEFSIFGFTFSFWNIWIWSFVAVIIVSIVVRFFND